MHSLTSTVKLVRPYLVLYIAQRELCRGAEGEGGGGRREEEEEGERGRREEGGGRRRREKEGGGR